MNELPRLFILGAPKAGTTTMASWWHAHPEGFTAPEKEVGFFTVHYDRGVQWYRSRFAAAAPDQVGCDASPGYLYDDTALDRLAVDRPDARLVVLLREPVARVWSHWCYNVVIGVEPRSFSRVLREEIADESATPPGFPLGYLRGSRYLPRLQAVRDRFSREQLLVLFTDDLQADPAGAFARLCRHVGVSVINPPANDVRNVGGFVRSRRLQWWMQQARLAGLPKRVADPLTRWNLTSARPELTQGQRRQLETLLHPDLPSLADWLGEPLPSRWSASAR